MQESACFTVERYVTVSIIRFAEGTSGLSVEDISSSLREWVDRERPRRLVVDLDHRPTFGDVAFFSGMFLNVLIHVWRSVSSYGGEMRLCQLDERVLEALECSVLKGTIFEVHDNVASATSSF